MKKKHLKTGSPEKEQAKSSKQPKEQGTRNRYTELFGLGIMILLGIIIYSNSFTCTFHLDDSSNIVVNTAIRDLSNVHAWWSFNPRNRPVAVFTFALNYHFNQLDVRYWHLVNLLIHLIASCLVGWLTLLLFSTPALRDNPVSKHKKSIALFTALLFVSHPLATQSVTYIVQRLSALVAMFYLLSVALYVKARLSKKNNASTYLLYAGAVVSAMLAMLTKENAFTLPFAILLVEIFLLQSKKLSISIKDYRMLVLTGIMVSFAAIVFLRFSSSVFRPIPPSLGNNYTVTSLNYLFTQFSVIVKYIQLLILPINQNLDYDYPIANSFFEIRTVLSFLFLAALIVLAVFLYNRNRIISFGIFWFFLTLSIESSIIPINDLIFEHRTYLPSFGFFLILSSGIYMWGWDKYKNLSMAILLLIIGSNSILTYQRNKVWKDELTLWSDVVSKSPNKARPINYRGLAYKNQRQWDKALTDYSRAIEIDPKFIAAYSNRGVAYSNLGQRDKAIADFSTIIELDPKQAAAYNNRGNTYGNLGLWDKAIADFSKAVEIDPKYVDGYNNLGSTYGNVGDWDKAIIYFSKAIEIAPPNARFFNNRGIAYGKLGQWDKAIADYSKAIGIDEKYAEAYSNREIAYRNLKK